MIKFEPELAQSPVNSFIKIKTDRIKNTIAQTIWSTKNKGHALKSNTPALVTTDAVILTLHPRKKKTFSVTHPSALRPRDNRKTEFTPR